MPKKNRCPDNIGRTRPKNPDNIDYIRDKPEIPNFGVERDSNNCGDDGVNIYPADPNYVGPDDVGNGGPDEP